MKAQTYMYMYVHALAIIKLSDLGSLASQPYFFLWGEQHNTATFYTSLSQCYNIMLDVHRFGTCIIRFTA